MRGPLEPIASNSRSAAQHLPSVTRHQLMGQPHPHLGDVGKPLVDHQGLLYSAFSAYLWAIKRADERTRTADLLITSDRSGVAGLCTRLQIPHI